MLFPLFSSQIFLHSYTRLDAAYQFPSCAASFVASLLPYNCSTVLLELYNHLWTVIGKGGHKDRTTSNSIRTSMPLLIICTSWKNCKQNQHFLWTRWRKSKITTQPSDFFFLRGGWQWNFQISKQLQIVCISTHKFSSIALIFSTPVSMGT